uniref:Uncharacterized protein n=1 Tax=Biomphalaria glabrata TaxID=6526 RepID=A0A2C9KLI3_BIOGL
MKLFSLTVSVLIVRLSVCGPAAMSGIVLTQKDTMNLLNEIMKQLDQNEERLINITDSTVEALYKQSKTIPVEIQKFFQITQSIKDTFPAQETALNELASHLVTASDSLTQVISQCSNKKIIPNASSRKTKKAIPENSPVVRSFSPTLIKRQTGPQVAGGASNNNVDSVTNVLIRPVEINKTAVDAAVSSVGKSNYFLVGEAADVVLKLGIAIAEKHRTRYVNLLPKIKLVGGIITDILNRMDELQNDVSQILDKSEAVSSQVRHNLTVIQGLAQSISSVL